MAPQWGRKSELWSGEHRPPPCRASAALPTPRIRHYGELESWPHAEPDAEHQAIRLPPASQLGRGRKKPGLSPLTRGDGCYSFSEMNSKVLIAVVIGAATAALAATLVLMAFGTDSAGAIGGGVGGAVGAAVGAQMAGKSKKDE